MKKQTVKRKDWHQGIRLWGAVPKHRAVEVLVADGEDRGRNHRHAPEIYMAFPLRQQG